MQATLEQQILKLSIVVTLAVSGLGVIFGLVSGSHSILFDGVFSSIDAAMSALALAVSRLIVKESSPRFQLGYWHLEPMVAALNGSILLLLCFYAFLNAVSNLLQGGNPLGVGTALGYSLIVCVVCFAMVVVERRLNRHAGSEFVRIDIQNWLMAGLITTVLLVAFVVAWLMQGTRWAGWIPYLDSVLLAILTLCFLPIPAATVHRAMREVLMVAPSRLDGEVRAAMGPVMQRDGLISFDSYVAKSGRVYNIEIHVLTTSAFAAGQGVAVFDEIRQQIAEGLSVAPEQRWFTVSFTADPRWL